MAKATMEILCDAGPFCSFANLLQRALKLFHLPFDRTDLPEELIRFENDFDATDAGHLIMRLYPSDALLDFTAAFFARNINLRVIEESVHE